MPDTVPQSLDHGVPAFEDFLRLWHVRDAETEQVLRLDEPWPSQLTYADAAAASDRLTCMKGRKVGVSVAATAYSAWRILRTANGLALTVSVNEKAAVAALDRIELGLRRLPDGLRPVDLHRVQDRLVWGTDDDLRTIIALPASPTAGRDLLANHVLVDEASVATHAADIFQSVEPSVAQNGSIHVVFVPADPAEFVERRWSRANDVPGGAWKAVYIPADARPGRPPEWFEAQIEDYGATYVAREYSRTAEEALAAVAEAVLATGALHGIADSWEGLLERAAKGRTYVTGFDPAKTRDNAALITIDAWANERGDLTAEVVNVRVLAGVNYVEQADIAAEIQRNFGSKLAVERTGVGAPIVDMLLERVDAKDIVEINTTESRKRQWKQLLEALVQRGGLGFDPAASDDLETLYRELLTLQWAGKHDGDSAMALLFALSTAAEDLVEATKRKKRKGHGMRPIIVDGPDVIGRHERRLRGAIESALGR